MTYTEMLKTDGIFETLSQTLAVIGKALVTVSYAGSVEREVTKLSALSDEELAQRGTTRNAEITRIFDTYGWY